MKDKQLQDAEYLKLTFMNPTWRVTGASSGEHRFPGTRSTNVGAVHLSQTHRKWELTRQPVCCALVEHDPASLYEPTGTPDFNFRNQGY